MSFEPLRQPTAEPAARLDDARRQLGDGAAKAKSGLLSGFGRVVDALEGQIHRAPTDLQPHAQKAVGFARQRPLATMAGLAVGLLFLTRGARRR